MRVTFIACDKHSSASYTKSVDPETKEELNTAWKEFEKEIPFSKWYSDNTNDSDNPEVDEWLDDLS